MATELFKRLFISFLISFGVTLLYTIPLYLSTTGLEEKQGVFIMVLVLLLLNLLNFILSLTAFLVLNAQIRESLLASMISFLFLPFLLFTWLSITVIKATNQTPTVKDFEVLLPSLVFCFVLVYQFYTFRTKHLQNS